LKYTQCTFPCKSKGLEFLDLYWQEYYSGVMDRESNGFVMNMTISKPKCSLNFAGVIYPQQPLHPHSDLSWHGCWSCAWCGWLAKSRMLKYARSVCWPMPHML
jgi:hypothetical protein